MWKYENVEMWKCENYDRLYNFHIFVFPHSHIPTFSHSQAV